MDFVGSALLACLVIQAPHPAMMGTDVEGNEGADRLLAMLHFDILEGAEAGMSAGQDVEMPVKTNILTIMVRIWGSPDLEEYEVRVVVRFLFDHERMVASRSL